MPQIPAKQTLLPPLILALTLMSGCVSLYKPEIQQGNVVSTEMLESLKPGMSKRQVVFLLGTPLITDPFHQERWDYFYSLSKNGGKPEQRHLTVYFKGDEVSTVDGDIVPEPLKKPGGADPT
jgi:outer membrane protein assembly factor BamE